MDFLTSAADAVTRSMLALLSLTGALLVFVGLAKAWRARLRTQVVIEDISAIEDLPASATSGLSALLRQAVRSALLEQGRNASYAVVNTFHDDVRDKLLVVQGRLTLSSVQSDLRSSAEDSLTLLAEGIRTIAPKESVGFLAAISAALPQQRGWSIHAFPIFRTDDLGEHVGLTLELCQLGYPPDAATTFWAKPDGDASSSHAASVRDKLHELLKPAGLWIATRLVSRHLAGSVGRKGWGTRAEAKRELHGLQLQLAGQMSLYSSASENEYGLNFADQAIADCGEASQILPRYYRPCLMQGNALEKSAWSHYLHGRDDAAARDFLRALKKYEEAVRRIDDCTTAEQVTRSATVGRVKVRMAKCRLLSGDRAEIDIAVKDLPGLEPPSDSKSVAMYNAACLYAIASSIGSLSADEQARYEARAWKHLGAAFLRHDTTGLPAHAMADPELAHLGGRQIKEFWDRLRRTQAEYGDSLSGQDAVLELAVRDFGIRLPDVGVDVR